MLNELIKKLINLRDRFLVPILLLLVLLGTALTVKNILALPGGITLARLLMLAIPAVVALLGLPLLVLSWRNDPLLQTRILSLYNKPQQAKFIQILLPVVWIILFIIACLPFSSLGRWGALYVRIQPILQLFLLVATSAWIIWLFYTRATHVELAARSNEYVVAGIILAVFIGLVWLIVSVTGKGIGLGTQYWGKTGIPILTWQIGAACVVMLCFSSISRFLKSKKIQPWLIDVLIFFTLWIVAFIVWQNIPISTSRYVTNAYPPNYASYPYSDAGDYALQSEAILLGNGYQYGFIDKPLHLLFLSFLSLLGGADFSKVLLLQVLFLAAMPGLIYLITSKIFNRLVGIVAGIICLFLQNNNLYIADRIQATNVKMAMSESLTAMMLMLVCLALIAWWKKPHSSLGFPALAGSLLGLAGLVRLNVLVIIPIILTIWLLAYGLKKRTTWMAALVFVVFCILPLVPWGIRNQVVLGNPLGSYLSKTKGVIIRQRILPIINSAEDESKNEQPGQVTQTAPQQNQSSGLQSVLDSMLHAGFHNLVTVGLPLPASTSHTGLDETIRLPYWDQEWDGTFARGGQLVLAGSLIIVVIGFSAGWKKNRVVVLIPFIILFSYLLANSVSLVSGGRYIVPVDWVVPIYYSSGITVIILWAIRKKPVDLFDTESGRTTSFGNKQNLWIGVGAALVISCLPTIADLSIPKFYVAADNQTVFEEIKSIKPELPANLTWEELSQFSQNKDASFKRGTAMFPRWMKTGEGDTAGSGSAYSGLPFDHLSFSVLSDDQYPFDAVLPINEQVKYFPNSSDMILVGCKTEAYFDTALVILKTQNPVVYSRPDITHLTCPLPQP